MRLGWSVALLVMMAGCADDAPAEAAGAQDAPDLAETDEARQARAPSGAAIGSALPDPIELAWDGALDLMVCVPSGVNSCQGTSTSVSGKEDSQFIGADPATWSGQLTLTWTAAAPTSDTLQLGLTFYKKCGGTCWESVGTGAYTSGKSPLVLDVEGASAPASAEGLWVSVRQPRLTPDPIYAVASLEQEFRVEGLLTPSLTPPA